MQMKLVSLNVGLPREVTWHGMRVTTGIFKQPVAGRVMLRRLNLDGDRQADLTVHGGEHKAVYCYPLQHYEFWKNQLPGRDLPMGMFGENFTLDFLDQDGRGTEGGERKEQVPPVMITVANNTYTAARVEFFFKRNKLNNNEALCDPERLLHIDSRVLDQAEEEDEPVQLELAAAGASNSSEENGEETVEKKLSKKDQAELLRLQVDTVGQVGQPGEKIQNVISVGMLSEGWDARTVTHISRSPAS